MWLEEKRKQVCVERGLVYFIGRVEGSSVYVGLAHHTVVDGLGLEEVRRRIIAGDSRVRSPSYLDYARWQEESRSGSVITRSDLVGVEVVELGVASELYVSG
jgi:hypothetical protein